MTLLEIIKAFCHRTALPVPSVVATSKDDQLLQLMGLANEVCEDLLRYTWEQLQYETTFTSAASTDQGALTTLAPNAFKKILNDTIFDRTRGLPFYGPLSASQWQAQKSLTTSGPFYQYRIRNGHLLTNTALPAGHTLSFEYLSSGIVQDNSTNPATVKEYFTRDDDTFLLDTSLMLLGLRWRWKEEKGLPFATAQQLYETRVANASAGDGTKPVLCMDSPASAQAQPGIWVPSGNWVV